MVDLFLEHIYGLIVTIFFLFDGLKLFVSLAYLLAITNKQLTTKRGHKEISTTKKLVIPEHVLHVSQGILDFEA